MSNRYVHAYSRVMHDIQSMSTEELEQSYGIDIAEDGSVWDVCEMKTYETITMWATAMNELEREDAAYVPASSRSSKSRYQDDY